MQAIKTISYQTIFILLLGLLCNVSSAKIIYVDDNAPVSSIEDSNGGANDGTSWENAYIYPQEALAYADELEAIPPIADAGSSRYVGADPVLLDGTGSYDPDNSSLLSYSWRQISGPDVEIIDANTATPTIDGFTQTNEIQELELELVVSDGELTSLPDTVKILIVPDFGNSTLELENPPFDPNKPTIIYFSGGNCIIGFTNEQKWGTGVPEWYEKANIISFPLGYEPDPVPQETWSTYYHLGDMVIVYLSEAAPDYEQMIQTVGWSTGGQPATDVGIRLNRIYQDARYNVNHVAMLDTPCRLLQSMDILTAAIELYLSTPVDDELCWMDGYSSAALDDTPDNIALFAHIGIDHSGVRDWYRNSLGGSDADEFNKGIVAGAYWSVVGPGRNLQPARNVNYYYRWSGDRWNGSMGFFNESSYPGRLPEPVTLIGPPDGTVLDANGVVLSCEVSENAADYQLLLGSDPHRVMDYTVVSETPEPPSELMTKLPFLKTYWTVRVNDEFGSTIFADPLCIYVGDPNMLAGDEPLPGVAYIYSHKSDEAQSFQSLLDSYGCSTTLIKSKNVTATSLDSFDLILVADDTQSQESWTEPNAIFAIENCNKPVIGLGDGGYDFFGLLGLSIGSPYGGHGSVNSIIVIDPNCSLFSTPYPVEIPVDGVLQIYTETNHVGIYLWPTVPENITVFGSEKNDPGYFPLVMEDNKYFLWGFMETPEKMTDIGKRVFINTVIWMANAGWENEN